MADKRYTWKHKSTIRWNYQSIRNLRNTTWKYTDTHPTMLGEKPTADYCKALIVNWSMKMALGVISVREFTDNVNGLVFKEVKVKGKNKTHTRKQIITKEIDYFDIEKPLPNSFFGE